MFATEKELTALLGEVEKEFSSFLTKAETSLAKSEKADSKKADEEEEKPEVKEDTKEDKPESKEEAPAFAAEAAPAAEAQAEAAPADAAPAQTGHGYDPEDMAHMDAMYSSMSREELIAHHDSVKKALDAMSAQDQAAPQAPLAPLAPGMDAIAPMQKSETDTVVEVKPEVIATQETELLKSEIAAKDSKINELNRTLEAVTQFVTKLVEKKGAPTGKAITQIDSIAKSEAVVETKDLSKKEITAKLSVKASDPKLEKSDREAINAYYASGQINLTGISHLLK